MWVFDADSNKMVNRNISYVPGLYKIFDEIVVNAADNKQRDSNMTELRIEINREKNQLSVYNNGQGIPVVMHKEHGIYVPELIFGARPPPPPPRPRPRRPRPTSPPPAPRRCGGGRGRPWPSPAPRAPAHPPYARARAAGHLLTSSNYNDDKKKVTGGRNGYGAKLANIFSSEFIVETADGARARLLFFSAVSRAAAAVGGRWPLLTVVCVRAPRAYRSQRGQEVQAGVQGQYDEGWQADHQGGCY